MKRQGLTKNEVLEILQNGFPYLLKRFGVVRLALYGSFARDDPRMNSDVDILVEVSRPLGLESVALADYWEEKSGERSTSRRSTPFSTPCRNRTGNHLQRTSRKT